MDWIGSRPYRRRYDWQPTSLAVRRAPLMFGWILAGHQLGAGAVAYAAGAIRTSTSSYDTAFFASGALCMVAAIMVLFIDRRPAIAIVPATA